MIDDASKLLPICKQDYEHTQDYQLLLRAIMEQTKTGKTGGRIPKEKKDGMDSSVLQNPSDPDATYRTMANKQHRGYSANLIETVDEKGSVITDYQYDVNTRSDASFIKETIEKAEATENRITVLTDGAYGGEETTRLAEEKTYALSRQGCWAASQKRFLQSLN
ncbi:MAG: transposase [Enterocloster bolteae]|uniref:transposase n=1 Tax=Enterocloster bolteae TaxID=208479 RepID=UPI003995E313